MGVVVCVVSAAVVAPAASPQTPPPVDVDVPDDRLVPGPFRYSHRAMGTEFVFRVYPQNGEGWDDLRFVADEAFSAIDALERDISSWQPQSTTSVINREASRRPVAASRDVWDLLVYSQSVYRETGGAFDVTVGPLIDFWSQRSDTDKPVDTTALNRVLARTGMDKLRLDPETRTVSFAAPGMRISFGGIGKGLALDRAAALFGSYGIESALLSGGDSSIVALGAPPGRDFWKIRIYNPYTGQAMGVGAVFLRDEALSTSACYGQTSAAPCGILDPTTGRPVEGMLSATVIGPTGVQTDALSTAFFVMGAERTRAYCRANPETRAVLAKAPGDGPPRPVRIGNWD